MASSDDEYLDISFDDDEGEGGPGDVLDITFDDVVSPAPSVSPVRPRRPSSASSPTSEPEQTDASVPMLASGSCSRCGYALRPLEEMCPRCRLPASVAVENAVEKSSTRSHSASESDAESTELPAVSPQRGCSLFAVAGGIAIAALLIGVPLYFWNQPAVRARREYQAGLRAQLAADFVTARAHYRMALEFDPQMGLAAFSMGTTYLRIGDPGMVQSVQDLTEQAVQGRTAHLDEADRWFRDALSIGQRLPPSTRLMDQRINSPPRLRAFAHACLALTALIRASAAIQADELEDGIRWYGVAGEEAQAAILDDPSNESANRVLRALPPSIPRAGSLLP